MRQKISKIFYQTAYFSGILCVLFGVITAILYSLDSHPTLFGLFLAGTIIMFVASVVFLLILFIRERIG
jgi:hypothetical protein